MGRWMELVREGPPDPGAVLRKRPRALAELSPYPLLDAALAVPKERRTAFPILTKICPFIEDRYEDESLWLDPSEASQLAAEFNRLWAICNREEFITGLDGARVLQHWIGNNDRPDFEDGISGIQAILRQAVDENCWIHLML